MRSTAISTAILSALLATLAAACGGREFDLAGDGGADAAHPDGGTGGDGGGACTPMPGCSSTTTCPLDCNTCSCMAGSWACTALACVDASTTCPATMPPQGTFCPSNGQQCSNFGGRCPPQCTCDNHAWRCTYPPCVAPPPCPVSPPRGGDSCTAWQDETCTYGAGCGTTSCKCAADPSPTWSCVATGCVDAGH